MGDNTIDKLRHERSAVVTFVDGLLAEAGERDLTDQELEMVQSKRSRIDEIDGQLSTLVDFEASRAKVDEITAALPGTLVAGGGGGPAVEYDSLGAYINDVWQAGGGVSHARSRVATYHRALSHEITSDLAGTIPDPIMGPVWSAIDSDRPIVSTVGVKPIPGGPTFYRPKVTAHQSAGPQASSVEKNELPSSKLTIDRVQVDVEALGSALNVSRQAIDWSVPSAMDLVIADMGSAYAVASETAAGTALMAGATDSGETITEGTTDAAGIAAAFWAAAGGVYGSVKGRGRVVAFASPDVLGTLGPAFAPVNPQNAHGQGFSAGGYGQGAQGSIAGVPVIVSAGLAADSLVVASTAAFECFEAKGGVLSVVEPSVLGVQVAWFGYFGSVVMETGGLQKITHIGAV